ncbi:MAG: hypothetical protein ABSH32_07045 [Bryobacteraceae bacterium]|jgi:hypothetical protein
MNAWKLTERHEAQSQSLELLTHDVATLHSSVQALAGALQTDAENIRALARIAEIHERRLTVG